MEEWKKIEFPRISETLFAIITFFFEHLLNQFLESERTGKKFEGRINLRNIGMKDFWNRLAIAYHDLLIQDLLVRNKRSKKTTTQAIVDEFPLDFEELYGNLMTGDPVDMLVHAAALMPAHALVDHTVEKTELLFQVNFFGTEAL